MPPLRSSMRGKKSGACQRASHDARGPRPFPGAPDEARATPSPISGSRPISLGCAWCALCLGTHQPKLSPMSAFATMRPSKRLRRRAPKTWLCPASWPMKPSWVNIIPTNGATARAVHELPTMTNRAHPAKKAKIVRVIFTR